MHRQRKRRVANWRQNFSDYVAYLLHQPRRYRVELTVLGRCGRQQLGGFIVRHSVKPGQCRGRSTVDDWRWGVGCESSHAVDLGCEMSSNLGDRMMMKMLRLLLLQKLTDSTPQPPRVAAAFGDGRIPERLAFTPEQSPRCAWNCCFQAVWADDERRRRYIHTLEMARLTLRRVTIAVIPRNINTNKKIYCPDDRRDMQ